MTNLFPYILATLDRELREAISSKFNEWDIYMHVDNVEELVAKIKSIVGVRNNAVNKSKRRQ